MSRKLYLECGCGISGDMTVAALLDLGADKRVLEEALHSLPMEGYRTEIKRVVKSGLDACDFQVILDEEHENHDHDMEYLHGEAQEHGHSHAHEEEHQHNHSHVCGEDQYQPPHHHRHLADIMAIIEQGNLTRHAKDIAARIFLVIAEAEAKAHGVTVDRVHFHEVGAVDSIVDIVAAAVCLDNLDISEVIVPEVNEGCGSVRCQHGVLPVPVPAVVNIAVTYGITLHRTDIVGELVTPTGAAIVAAVRTGDRLPAHFKIEGAGLGAGKRKYEGTGILRAMLIQDADAKADIVYKLETNIDDCSGEVLGFTKQRLFNAGAREVYNTPVYMKKNRPGYQLTVLCEEKDIECLEQIIFEETTTIGIRRVRMERTVLDRELRTVNTSLGEARVKVCRLMDGRLRYYPEYSSVCALSEENRVSYREAYDTVCREAEEKG